MEDRLLTEKQFMEMLELQQKDMEALRRAGFPFVRAGKRRRLTLFQQRWIGLKKT